ncbi:MAG TPA: hypothetical protein VG937_28815 [Polyangiaceae bacterium]|nr:hypothetical protein [Polyangiaceae bacterium]
MVRCWLLALALSLPGCAHHARPVEFQGLSSARVVSADAVIEVSATPRGAERLGRLFVRCRPVVPDESFSELSLLDVDCSEQRLRRLLREAASEHGGDVLSELSCEQRASISCRATLARREQGSAPSVKGRPIEDVRGELGAEVLVSFESSGLPGRRSPRAPHNVREVSTLGPAQLPLGNLETRCEACSELSAREALRIAAGQLGAADVVAVRCVSQGTAQRCLGVATVWESP